MLGLGGRQVWALQILAPKTAQIAMLEPKCSFATVNFAIRSTLLHGHFCFECRKSAKGTDLLLDLKDAGTQNTVAALQAIHLMLQDHHFCVFLGVLPVAMLISVEREWSFSETAFFAKQLR